MFSHLLHHPRRLWIRKAIFQVHLWGGVFLALYLVVIALTGSVLVFENELTGLTLPSAMRQHGPVGMLTLPEIVGQARRAYPAMAFDNVTAPTPEVPAYVLQARAADGTAQMFAGDTATGEIVPLPRTWVQWVHDLHVYLLLNQRYGMQVNGVGAAVLLLLVVSGIALWWPGVRTWARGLRVNLRANWRRVNYDLHSAIGFWTLFVVFWWALSGVYFGFYRPFTAAVNAVLPIRNMRAPAGLAAASSAERVSLEEVLAAARQASPRASLYSTSNVLLKQRESYVLMDLGELGDFTHRDIVRVDATNGRVLSVWHYSEKHSLGDWVMWLMHPLHFGTLWGMGVKVLWSLFGVLLAGLSVTGVVMYWNRYLRRVVMKRSASTVE